MVEQAQENPREGLDMLLNQSRSRLFYARQTNATVRAAAIHADHAGMSQAEHMTLLADALLSRCMDVERAFLKHMETSVPIGESNLLTVFARFTRVVRAASQVKYDCHCKYNGTDKRLNGLWKAADEWQDAAHKYLHYAVLVGMKYE